MSAFGFNVFDFGARGDGKTDDTAAIQRAIDFCAARGGGRICFPYTAAGYRIASPGREEYNGRPLRAQLVIPPGAHSILLEGEMPCHQLNAYQIQPMRVGSFTPTVFGSTPNNNTFLFSDWQAPEVHDADKRPWALIAAPEEKAGHGHSVSQFSMKNLELRVAMDRKRMYPTQSAANLQNVSRINIADSLFCLGETVGDTLQNKELQPNPCHTAGLILAGEEHILQNVTVQGFRYGIVAGGRLTATSLCLQNCEKAVTFFACPHLSTVQHLLSQHNRIIIATARHALFGIEQGACHLALNTLECEDGVGLRPQVSQLYYAVLDPENSLHGRLAWHKTKGDGKFPIQGAARMTIAQLA